MLVGTSTTATKMGDSCHSDPSVEGEESHAWL